MTSPTAGPVTGGPFRARFVDQTMFGTDFTQPDIGDCMRACVASLLAIPLSDVPNFWDLVPSDQDPALGYGPQIIAWARSRGWTRLHIDAENVTDWMRAFGCPGTLAIIGGRSPRATEDRATTHAVVGQWTGVGWTLVHDPHPDGGGLVGDPTTVSLFVPFDPSRFV